MVDDTENERDRGGWTNVDQNGNVSTVNVTSLSRSFRPIRNQVRRC